MVEATTTKKEGDVPTTDPSTFSLLLDPCNDRTLTDAQCAIMVNKPLTDEQFWPDGELPDWKVLKDFMTREGKISKDQMMRLLNQTLEMFKKESNLVQIPEPICVVGDIHGQYSDLLNMISKAGEPGSLNYLFLGDYVDRGIFGIEVCVLLFSIKLNQSKSVIMLRGNHESRNMTETFTFREEVM